MAVQIDPNLKKVIKSVATEMELSEVLVTSIYYQYCKTLKTEIEKLPLKDSNNILTEEQFSKLHTCFNIKNIGKIYVKYSTYLLKNSITYGKRKSKKN